jgi:hypothetical protein
MWTSYVLRLNAKVFLPQLLSLLGPTFRTEALILGNIHL